jgi:2-polyprenyl-3-methyl-5-hydroxy-6-metoxy-1,4-benzoquinol methylase
MKNVQDFYNKYQYPKSKQYTKKQIKNNKKILLKILNIGNINLEFVKYKRILVAGCGTAEKAILLAKNKANVIAIDFSFGQLKQAKKRAINNNVKVIFYKKDIIKDNLENLGKFDIILSLGVLHHTENTRLGFNKLCKLLAKNGVIIIGLYHKYARLRYKILRFIFRNFVTKNPDKLIDWIKNKQIISKNLKKAPISTLYDRYCVPFESYYTLREVKKWFKENKITFIKNSNNVNGIELFRIFEKKTIFFVSGNKLK